MTKWTSAEKNVGALSAKWPKNADDLPSYWKTLHESVDGVRHLMTMLDDVFESIDNDSDLLPSGRAKRRIEQATSVLKELDGYALLQKASNLVERRIAKVKEKVTVLPESPTGADLHLAAEIRASIKSEKEPERFAFSLRSNPKVMAAVLAAPAFLSGLTDEGIERLREAALHALHPKEIAEVEQLTAAEKVAREALVQARNRIAERAGLVKATDGTWTIPDAKATT